MKTLTTIVMLLLAVLVQAQDDCRTNPRCQQSNPPNPLFRSILRHYADAGARACVLDALNAATDPQACAPQPFWSDYGNIKVQFTFDDHYTQSSNSDVIEWAGKAGDSEFVVLDTETGESLTVSVLQKR